MTDILKQTALIIPARLKATRLPNKPILKIGNKEMILHVFERAKKSGLENIFIACSEDEVAKLIRENGGKAILTDPDIPTGTDRVYKALKEIELNKSSNFKYVINLQGDMPNFNSEIITQVIDVLVRSGSDISTLCAETTLEDAQKHQVVKPAFGEVKDGYAKALYFSRNIIPYGAEKYYHHLGIYGFKKEALEKFVHLKPSKLELEEKLEQLRALENGMTISIGFTKDIPISVDTPDDLENARKIMGEN